MTGPEKEVPYNFNEENRRRSFGISGAAPFLYEFTILYV